MAEKKDTNPFSSYDSSNPHLPPSAYQPNPFPINPTEGNPWASSNNAYQHQGHVNNDNSSSTTYSYGHGYNTSSDETQSSYPAYMPMPSPSTYKADYSNNAYNAHNAYNVNAYNSNTGSEVNAYEQSSQADNNKDEYNNNNTTELDQSAITANPGIEAHDPDKLNISSQALKDSKNTPNKMRLLSRLIQFIASVGDFAFSVSASPATKTPMPDGANKVAIIFVYIVSAISIIYSFGHLIFYCLRRCGGKNKAPRWALLLVDAILGACFGVLMVFLIKDFKCNPGTLNGWCDFYNTSIFFTVLAFVTYAISFMWDIIGGCKRK